MIKRIFFVYNIDSIFAGYNKEELGSKSKPGTPSFAKLDNSNRLSHSAIIPSYPVSSETMRLSNSMHSISNIDNLGGQSGGLNISPFRI
jgi:hypothetical protein